MRLAVIKRKCKDCVKKVITRKYCVACQNVFDRRRYYIIRRKTPWAGFYANYLHVAGHTVYALKKGYIPVVDMQNYPTLYNEKGLFMGTYNAWEYFFKQPGRVSIETAIESKNYILSDFSTMREYIPYRDGNSYFEIEWEKSKPIIDVIFEKLQPRKEIMDEVDDFFRTHCENKKVLGIHYRGTDKKVEVKNHFLSAPLTNYLRSVEECMLDFKPDIILLCTDDQEAISFFSQKYPGGVVFSNAFRAEIGDVEGIHLKKNVNREHHNYLLGKEVIMDVMLLARCNYFVFSHSNVATSVMLINNRKFEKTYFVAD